ncbi:MAG TPA: aminopeptidase [Candidatus Dormibacteraeota bacterium]|nr:aminopeptidase [Candidatus Dormibacteraeota bacterium]
MNDSERLTRLAELTVSVGLNMQRGQVVVILGMLEHAALVREIARAAYRAGARRVDPMYIDRHLTKAHIELGPEETLDDSPPTWMAMVKMLEDERGAFVQVVGEPDPTLLAGLDGKKVGRARPREWIGTWSRLVGDRLVNWTIVSCATPGWAQQVFGRPDVDALWLAIEKAMRLDRPDPVAAWRDHVVRLNTIATALNEHHFDELRYRGPGTDFRVGLLPSSRWEAASTETTFGVTHVANMPTEEVYTSPDYRRAEGKLRSTMPLQLYGTMIRDLELEFRDGQIVQVNASEGADVIRAEIATDPGATRLGEISLVDGSSEVGKLGLTFCNTLFDENATCHVAYGAGFAYAVADEKDRAAGLNESKVHTDFMVGGPEVEIEGRASKGAWVPVIKDNEFQLG